MADRSVLTTSTFNDFRREVNGTARDIGDISDEDCEAIVTETRWLFSPKQD